MKLSKIVVVMASSLWLMVMIGCSSPDPVSNAKPSSTPIQSRSTQTTAAPENGWNPQEACKYLSGISGFQTRGYKNQIDNGSGEAFTCSSPYLEFDAGTSAPNNVAYYVNGNSKVANELKIVLNVNSSQPTKLAHEKVSHCQ